MKVEAKSKEENNLTNAKVISENSKQMINRPKKDIYKVSIW